MDIALDWEYVNGMGLVEPTPMECTDALESGEDVMPQIDVFRAKVPRGWLVVAVVNDESSAMAFYPDPGHMGNE